ncbi:hypothetical protein [Rhizobium sp. SSA_523]|uniref:hypothetical protein n=1 Tax=Rhizobium sp. SSA_523 TaxID=2952477 RepID=UPI002091511A|nr:hypothetical protein [Rhizobium sp. SSA_523]MCO5734693.1 hypothetical protein [Rhizobium sp. SSA_523]WKC20981.1 hypothetical protein QTJ18_00220 [Rhizobium sp. SSA_523]
MLAKLTQQLKEMLQSIKYIQQDDLAYLSREMAGLAGRLDRITQLNANLYIDLVKQTAAKYADPRCIAAAPGQVYSQNNEDGIISEIFRRIGTESRTFIEIAAGDGIENTTRLLLETGWRGLWVEAGPAEADCIRNLMRQPMDDGRLVFVNDRVTPDNVEAMVEESGFVTPDYVSVDIDYNTAHVWRRLMRFRPRLFCIEFNGHYPPSLDFEVPYDQDKAWTGTTRFGASLKALERIGAEHGYCLVGCDIFGVNAFFVRQDLCREDLFIGPYTAEQHYEPPRYSAVAMRGHARHLPFADA